MDVAQIARIFLKTGEWKDILDIRIGPMLNTLRVIVDKPQWRLQQAARKLAAVLLVLRRRGVVLATLDRSLVAEKIARQMLLSFREATEKCF